MCWWLLLVAKRRIRYTNTRIHTRIPANRWRERRYEAEEKIREMEKIGKQKDSPFRSLAARKPVLGQPVTWTPLDRGVDF